MKFLDAISYIGGLILGLTFLIGGIVFGFAWVLAKCLDWNRKHQSDAALENFRKELDNERY